MAEERLGGEPTEPPSEKRLRDARDRGEVAKSREIVSVAVFLAAAGALAWAWSDIFTQLRELMRSSLANAPWSRIEPGPALSLGLRTLVRSVMAVLLISFIVAALAGLAHIGPLFTLHPLKPNLQRINPLKNATQIFGKKALFEGLKNIIKLVGMGYVGFKALIDQLPLILSTIGQEPETILTVVAQCLANIIMQIGIVMVLFAALDIFYQRYVYRKQLRMTRTEIQREQKENEGDPHHKAERQRVHREIVEHQMLEAVIHADCVIINPDHLAVAIRYEASNMNAPKVIARGQRLLAAKIREIARQRGIPIIRNVPLARALVELELDQEIPSELYEAVAEVLRFVYRLSGRCEEPADAVSTSHKHPL